MPSIMEKSLSRSQLYVTTMFSSKITTVRHIMYLYKGDSLVTTEHIQGEVLI